MRIGLPREIKPQEHRVGLTPESVAELVHRGHSVLAETRAGAGIGADDADYLAAGARAAQDARSVFDQLVDVAIDQGGCFETSRPTTHAEPTFLVDGIVHYCVANMPGAVPRTSAYALNNATLPAVLALADQGWRQALRDDPHLRAGRVTHPAVAAALGYEWVSAKALLDGG